jgi:SAM-dependent methyltransferase
VLTPYSERAVLLLAPAAHELALDVAAGPGTTSVLLAARAKHVTSVDFSRAMLKHLEQNIARLGLNNVNAEFGDGQALPYADASFQVAVSMFGLMFFPDRTAGFRELRRVLSPGGRAVVSSWAPVDSSPAMQLMFGALRAVDPSRPAPERDVTSLENPAVLRDEMERAGFTSVELHEVTADMGSDSPEQFWRDTTRGAAPLVLLRRRVGEAKWREIEGTAVGFIRDNWDPVRTLSSTAYLALGRV